MSWPPVPVAGPSPSSAASRQRGFVLRRRLPASPERVWAAWTTPDQLAAFFCPPGVRVLEESIELQLRPGGSFRVAFVDAEGSSSART